MKCARAAATRRASSPTRRAMSIAVIQPPGRVPSLFHRRGPDRLRGRLPAPRPRPRRRHRPCRLRRVPVPDRQCRTLTAVGSHVLTPEATGCRHAPRALPHPAFTIRHSPFAIQGAPPGVASLHRALPAPVPPRRTMSPRQRRRSAKPEPPIRNPLSEREIQIRGVEDGSDTKLALSYAAGRFAVAPLTHRTLPTLVVEGPVWGR